MNQNEQDNKPERTAMQASIQRKQDHIKWIDEKLSEELSSGYRADLVLEKSIYEKEIHKDQLLLPKEMEMIYAFRQQFYYCFIGEVMPEKIDEWYNKKYPNHGK